MDIRNLNTFIQVAELNSFTRAAERLGYSQPTVSIQIKQLEQELGVQLFERIGHTVSLTEQGKEILSYAQHICQLSLTMINNKNKTNHPTGMIRIGMADSLCAPLILNHFQQFRDAYPLVRLLVITAGTGDLFRLLDHNEVDMICALDAPTFDTTYRIIHKETISAHFVCACSHPLANKKNISLEALLKHPFLLTEKGMSYRRLLDEHLAKRGLEIEPVLEISNPDLICQLIEKNMGISFLPDYVTNKAVQSGTIVRIDVENFDIHLSKQLIYHRDKWVTASMEALIEHLSKIHLAEKNS